MEIMNCEYENNQIEIIKSTKNLADIVTKIKENFWDYEEEIDKIYSYENMKLYEAIFGDRTKYGGKNMSRSLERAEIIKIISNQIGQEKSFNLNFKKNAIKLKIDYLCLTSIANVIQRIIKNIINQPDFPQQLDDILDNNNFSRILDSEIWGLTLLQIRNDFKGVKELSFELSGDYDDEFEINYILLFYYFYGVFFPNVDLITIKLDFFQLSKIYMDIKDPYEFKEAKIKDLCKNYENLFLANFLLICIISLTNEHLTRLKIKATESFINENNYIIGKEFSNKKFKELTMKDNGLVLFKKLMKIKNITNMSFSINCLDRFLFKEMINFIALNRSIQYLELNLFYNASFYNQRKIYLNYLRGQEFHEIDPNIMDKYGIMYFPYINKLGEEITNVIEYDKIPDLLFPEFKKNLNQLKIILNQYLINLKEFILDITPYEELIKNQCYNVQIVLFILAILYSLEKAKEIEHLVLKCSNIDYNCLSTILKKLNNLITPKLIDLSKCEDLSNLTIDIQGISLLLDFEKLPFNSFKKLDFSISNLKDMEKVSSIFKKHKRGIYNLTQLNLSFPLEYDTNHIFKEFLSIFDNFPTNLKDINIRYENMMKKGEFLEIIDKTKKTKKTINCELKCDCPELGEFVGKDGPEKFKEFLKSKKKINLEKCQIIEAKNRIIKFHLFVLPDADKMNSIIFSFNKILSNSGNSGKTKKDEKDDNKNIFSNIFKFMGKKQKFDVILV